MGEEFSYTDALERTVFLVLEDGKLVKIINNLFRNQYHIQPDASRFAVVGDLHGHMNLALERLAAWETYSGLKFDAILQVGDAGVHDDHTVLDKTTREMAEKDPDELGFREYIDGSENADRFFGRNGIFEYVQFYFVAGNHDDPRVLAKPTLSKYSQITYVPNGTFFKFKKKNTEFKIGSLGDGSEKKHANKLRGVKLDILLTHQPPKSDINPAGVEELGEFVNLEHPTYTFFGHVHDHAPGLSLPYKGLFGLNEIKLKRGKPKTGGLGFLEISKTNSQFLYLPENYLK